MGERLHGSDEQQQRVMQDRAAEAAAQPDATPDVTAEPQAGTGPDALLGTPNGAPEDHPASDD